MDSCVRLFVHRRGNLYMRQVARLVQAEIDALGIGTQIVTEGMPGLGRSLDIVIAPHEYAVLEPRMRGDRGLEIMSRCAAITTEQPGTEWAALNDWLVRGCPAIVDLSPVAAELMAARGLAAEALAFGYTPYWDRWGGRDDLSRSHDAVILAAITPHREQALARIAPVLAEWRTRMLLFDNTRPVLESDPWFVDGEALFALMRSSRVLVNVRRDEERHYFEWIRCLPALLNGAVLVTEPSFGADPLEPVQHFVVGRGAALGAHLTALLDDEPLRRRIAQDAYETIRSVPPLSDSILRFVERSSEALARPVERHRPRPAAGPAAGAQDVAGVPEWAPGWQGGRIRAPFGEHAAVVIDDGDDLAGVALAVERATSSIVVLHRTGDRFAPRGVQALAEVLESDPGTAAAYGPVVAGLALTHHLPWDRSRLCRSPFLGGTAIVFRDPFVAALRAASVLLQRRVAQGDDLSPAWRWHLPWLMLAARGQRATFVPAVIGWTEQVASREPAPDWMRDAVLPGWWPDLAPVGQAHVTRRVAS